MMEQYGPDFYFGIFLLLFGLVGEIVLGYILKRDWQKKERKSNNIFFLIAMFAGIVAMPFVVGTFLKRYFS